jgi:rRNA maturation endonuclease Nob1
VISIKEVIVQDDQTSSVETLDGSNHDHHQGEATTTAAAAIAAAAREVLEVCSNESIDGSSHQNSETEGDLDNLTEQIHEIQSQLEQEIAKEAPQKVHFHDEEFPVTSVSAEEAPAFDEENFPSLGSVRTPFPAAASASTASSWAKKIAAPPSDSPVVFSNIKLPSKNYVLPSSSAHSQLSSCHTPADTESESTAHDPSSSRIISAGGGVGDYVSKAASTFMEAEDDGIGWINPTNLSGCRTTGEGMLHSQSKTLVKKSTEELAAVATVTPAGDTQTETKSLTKSQKRNMKKKARHTAAAAATAAGNATAKEERTEAMVSTGSAQILPEEAPLGFRNLPLPELRSPYVSSSVSSARRGGAVASVDRLVGCMTTDYAMQNVMLQMGLQVISLDGNVIRTVKQWILRCAGCYQIHYDMSRLFCSHCGLNMLQKISASIDSKTGELRLHLKKNYLPNRRGQVYSLPAPGTQDRFEGELLLREDQLLSGIWKQKVVKIRKDIRSAFGDDITSDVGLQINKGSAIKVGLGKRNPNAEKGRERRGKRKQKK